MSDDQDGCEWVNVSSGTGLTGSPGQKAVKQLCVCVCTGESLKLCKHILYTTTWYYHRMTTLKMR